MEVAIGSNNNTPFQREIREWQRIDPNTGALLTGRLEADRWINGPLNAYGKVVDSKNVSQPNGTQHTQRKQLEVLQAHTSSGSMQVIRAQTVQTTSSRWSSSKSSTSAVSYNSSTKSSAATTKTTHANNHLNGQMMDTDLPLSKKPFKAITNGYSINKNNYNGIHNGDNNQKESNHIFNNNNNNNNNNKKPQEYNHSVNGINNNNEQKPSNLSYHLQQQMMPTNSPIKTIETTSSSSSSSSSSSISSIAAAATIINGDSEHDHHLNNHLNDYNNCDNNSNINNKIKQQQQQNKSIRTGVTKTAAVTKTEPSLKLSNLMKSSNNNNDRSSSPHSFISTNKNSLNNFSTTLATAAKLKATQSVATTKTQIKKDKSSILTKVQQQQQQYEQEQQKQQQQHQNQFENGITSSPSMVLSLSSSSSSLLSSSTSTIASVQSFGNNNNNNNNSSSNIRTIQQNSHHLFQQQKDKKQKQQQQHQLPQIIHQQQHQPTLLNSSNSNLNSNCVGVTEGINEVGGFKHNNNSSSLITNGSNGYIDDIEEMTMDQPGKYSDFNFQRSRSASIDDLSTDWDEHNQTATDESTEWRRISKIRRSFQFPKTNSPPKTSPLRPIDLPENCSVNVSRIREELEKGRRLNAAMCNNTIDLLAMDNILNGSHNNTNGNNNDNIELNTEKSSKILNKKSPTFLTAESLKEIRGKLKKLSDESLYKDDFIINQSLNNDNIEKATTTAATTSGLLNHNDQSLSIVNIIGKDSSFNSSQMVRQQNAFQYYPKSNSQQSNHTTNSLENRTTRLKDTSSAEWHIRRKSYGFEKMSPPDNKMFRVENSTDSGLGRSSDLGNLSPTENRATVITFGNGNGDGDTTGNINGINKNSTTVVLNGVNNSLVTKPIVKRRYRDPNKSNLNLDESSEIKRHSIAVDETKYVRENLRKVFDNSNNSPTVHLNRLYVKEDNNGSTTVSLDETQRSQQQNRKRVEFCKTEVHFAAESGRVNIVETDGKPPPSNNFRRRRRSSGNAYIDAITSGLQVMHFGDENRSSATNTTDSNYHESDQIRNETTISTTEKSSVTVSIPSVSFERDINQLSSSSYLGKMNSPDENDEQDEISLRGILKNKPIKPKPYHLGENINGNDSLFGAKLKQPIGNSGPTEHTMKVQPLIRALEVDNIETDKISNLKSVADHIKIVEERKDVNGSYSTKINLSLTDKPYTWNSQLSPSSSPNDTHKIEQNDIHESGIQNPINARFRIIDTTTHNHNTITSSSASTTVMTKTNQDLKSTSLIMRTIRPIPQYERQISEPTKISTNLNENNFQQQQQTHLTNLIPLTPNMVSGHTTATKLISNMTAITKSNSANNILLNTSSNSSFAITDTASAVNFRKKYSSSLDGDTILNDDHIYRGGKVLKSSSFESAMSSSNSTTKSFNLIENISKRFLTNDNHLTATGQLSDENKKPIAVPRMKTTTTRPISMGSLNHNSQLRRIYEMTHNSDMESDDSVQAADEEVKRYLSNELLDQLDDNENSDQVVANSWSRVKTEKQTLKTEKIDIKDIPKSNVMSIQLQSPQSTRKIFTNIHETSKNIQAPIPIAKPRTTIQTINSPMNTEDSKINRNPVKLSPLPVTQTPQSKLLLDTQKIESNGARKLREHELLYFGIKVNSEEEEEEYINRTNLSNSKTRNQTIQSTINETNRKLHNNPKIIEETTQTNGSTTKWKLLCDKPDLLRHSPMERHQHNVPLIVNVKDETEVNQFNKTNEIRMQDEHYEIEEEDEENVGPIYENLKLPYPYNRKDDLIRDEMILSEMAKAADQTMKTVIDAHKTQKRRERRRSAQRHQSQPLDTIEEKIPPTSRVNESEKSYLQQTENSQRRSSLSRRSSSASSTGSFSDSGSLCGRLSRSRSKERLLDSKGHTNKSKVTLATQSTAKDRILNHKATKTSKKSASSPIAVTVRRAVEHRSSSRESQRSHTSSNENLHIVPPQKSERRHKRPSTSTTKTKVETTVPSEKYQLQKESTPLSRHRTERSSTESNDKHKLNRSSRNQTGTVPSDINHKKSQSSINRTTAATSNTDTTKHSQRISSRSRKDSADNSDPSNKMTRSSSRSSKERHNTERRSVSEHRRTGRSSHDRKENSKERHTSSRTLRNEKEDPHRTSTRSERGTRTVVSSDNLRNSKRSHKLEDSSKTVQSKDKLITNDNKTSIQHGTKTAIIPSASNALTTSKTITGKTTAQDGYNDNHHHHHHHHHHQHQHQHHGTTKHSTTIATPSSTTTKHRTKSKERQCRK